MLTRLLTSFLFLGLLSQSAHGALCSRVLSFTDGSVLTASQLNSEFNNSIDCLNSISDANISTSAAILPSKLSSTIAGDGIGRDSSTGILSVVVDNSTLEINSDTVRVKDLGITAAKLKSDASVDANRAVTTNHIRDLNVTTAKINDLAVTAAKIDNTTITSGKLTTAVQESLVPAGTILPFAGTTAPSGYLLCDGSQVSRTTYAALFVVISTFWGSGNGVTTFHLPDLRGRFLRGVDGGAGNDPDRTTRTAINSGGNTGDNVGSLQADAFANHAHDMTNSPSNSATADAGVAVSVGANIATRASEANGGNETRPKNAYVRYIIKH